MPALSDRIRVSKDGQYVLATGKRAPVSTLPVHEPRVQGPSRSVAETEP
jgi:hypothetical protein